MAIETKALNLTISEWNCILGALNFSMKKLPNTAFIRWGICYSLLDKIKESLRKIGG